MSKDFIVTDKNLDFVKSVAISPDKMQCSVIGQTDRMSISWRGVWMLICGAKLYLKNDLYCQHDPGKVWSEGFIGTISFKDDAQKQEQG